MHPAVQASSHPGLHSSLVFISTMLHSNHLSSLPFPHPTLPLLRLHSSSSSSLHFLRRLHSSSSSRVAATSQQSRLAELPAEAPSPSPPEGEGPVELPSSRFSTTLFASDDNPTPLQVSISVCLTGAVSVFLFRSLRRRAKRAKELRFRSSGLNKANDPKQVALDNLKLMGTATIDPGKPPSPVQAFLGSIAAGVICLILYKFTTTIEASLTRQALSDNYSVRQITITIRTIINGLCYLATFIFGINSAGLMLYSLQLAADSIFGDDNSNEPTSKNDGEQSNSVPPSEGTSSNVGSTNSELKSSDNSTDSPQ